IIHFFMILFAGYGTKISLRVSGDLNQISEFSLIIAMQGIALGQITSSQYAIVIIITSLSMLTTPYVMLNSEKIYTFFKPIMDRFKEEFWHRQINSLSTISKDIKDHIVVIGSDVMTEGFIKVVSRDVDQPIILVDYNPEKLLAFQNKRIKYVCGDINYKEVMNAVNLKEAKLAILTAPKFDTTIRFLKTAKTINPRLPIYVRAKTKKEALQLYELGADLVILPHVLESNYLLQKVYSFVKDGPERNKALRSEYLSYLKKEN
ncbi:MAG: cation:proton antiporter family protein, partial [archaeon]